MCVCGKVEAGDVLRFKRLFHYAREGRNAVADATDKDGRSYVKHHFCTPHAQQKHKVLHNCCSRNSPSPPPSVTPRRLPGPLCSLVLRQAT